MPFTKGNTISKLGGKASAKSRFKGKSKEEVSKIMSKLAKLRVNKK